MDSQLAEKRARWRRYFREHLTGSDAEVDAATEAAMQALVTGADVESIVVAGMNGADTFRRTGASPVHQRQAPSQGAGAFEPARSAPVSSTPPRAAGPRVYGSASSGIVSGFQQRLESRGRMLPFTVWNFRLERTDASGQPLPPVPVEMRAHEFNGSITNGDLVDVGRPLKAGELMHARRVRNETLGGVEVVGRGRRHRVLSRVIPTLVFILFACFVVYLISVNRGP